MAQPGDPAYEAMVYGDLWNRVIPERGPELVVRVEEEQDVKAVLRFARERGLKVVVRGGGHNWCQPTLRQGGILIDLSCLNRVLSIDAEQRRAVVQPVVSNRDLQAALNAQGLTFPSGHCPQVKLSGYLLGGGMAWNQGVWGAGTESVEAIDMVTPAGEFLQASRDHHADLFWAARGAGPGFFGVVTAFHLRLYPLPSAILGSTFYFPLSAAGTVGDWLASLAPSLSASIELSLFLLQAPAALQEAARSDGGIVCMVTAVSFTDSVAEGRRQLTPLESPPTPPLSQECAVPLDFPRLFDASGSLWPEGQRSRVEARFSMASPGDLARAVVSSMQRCPSPTTLVLFTVFTGPCPGPEGGATAYSMRARVYGGPWTMWLDLAQDAENMAWHQDCIDRLRPYTVGSYIGESDFIRRPATAVEAFLPQCWSRLADLRSLHDPDRLFFDFFEGLAEPALPSQTGSSCL
ncbi:FAD-binding oxidoreductase [Synechococcus sp. CBW1006]|uniref:FAD-binding oxidoreductase n=1 Tax=Synechococcus sp. CBW1006 TaxID=1353138 RepID=UPI0018CE102C|nr:FAD-binding oxidoreductase [Synechococcus sp. CBW1006]